MIFSITISSDFIVLFLNHLLALLHLINVLKLIICVRNGQFEFKYVLECVLKFDNFMNAFIFNYHKDSYLFISLSQANFSISELWI